ncbi:MAG: hypothetical protein ACD_39C01317G0001 [uncultured bacterium]|nr:MAG: hypothetical protein ACD_39C01317G0001 [uncultured bacterium]
MNNFAGAAGSIDNTAGFVSGTGISLQIPHHQIGIAHYSGQQIIKIISQTVCHHTKIVELLNLQELLFVALPGDLSVTPH